MTSLSTVARMGVKERVCGEKRETDIQEKQEKVKHEKRSDETRWDEKIRKTDEKRNKTHLPIIAP
jgi:hypothetical protein